MMDPDPDDGSRPLWWILILMMDPDFYDGSWSCWWIQTPTNGMPIRNTVQNFNDWQLVSFFSSKGVRPQPGEPGHCVFIYLDLRWAALQRLFFLDLSWAVLLRLFLSVLQVSQVIAPLCIYLDLWCAILLRLLYRTSGEPGYCPFFRWASLLHLYLLGPPGWISGYWYPEIATKKIF